MPPGGPAQLERLCGATVAVLHRSHRLPMRRLWDKGASAKWAPANRFQGPRTDYIGLTSSPN